MPLDLTPAVMADKNKLASTACNLIALEISIPGVNEPLRVVHNTESITWSGAEWAAFPFELDEVTDLGTGEVPRVEVRVSNVSRVMEQYIHQYDAWVKNNGYQPITCRILVVNTADIASGQPVVEHRFELKQPKTDANWCTFVLGASNPFELRYPRDMIRKNFCRFRFKGARCGYKGAAARCDKTLTRCRQLGNSERFGGFPGVGASGVYLAS